MKYGIKDIIEYTVWLVSEFAKKHGLSETEAYDYLSNFKAIPFVYDCYASLHTLSIEDGISDVTKICRRNGGRL